MPTHVPLVVICGFITNHHILQINEMDVWLNRLAWDLWARDKLTVVLVNVNDYGAHSHPVGGGAVVD